MIGNKTKRVAFMQIAVKSALALLIMVMCTEVSGQASPFDIAYPSRGQASIDAQMPDPVAGQTALQGSITDSSVTASVSSEIDDTDRASVIEPIQTTEEPTVAKGDRNKDDLAAEDASANDDRGPHEHSKWPLSLVLIASALITTLIINTNKQMVSRIFKAVLNPNYMNLLQREHRRQRPQLYFSHFMLFTINAGIFVYLSFVPALQIDLFFVWSILLCILVIGLLYACRHAFLSYLGLLYPFTGLASRFSFAILIFNAVLGILLLPINFLVAFSPQGLAFTFMILGWILISVLYLSRQVRGLLASLPLLASHFFYFLLYLCALEIAPIVLFWYLGRSLLS